MFFGTFSCFTKKKEQIRLKKKQNPKLFYLTDKHSGLVKHTVK